MAAAGAAATGGGGGAVAIGGGGGGGAVLIDGGGGVVATRGCGVAVFGASAVTNGSVVVGSPRAQTAWEGSAWC